MNIKIFKKSYLWISLIVLLFFGYSIHSNKTFLINYLQRNVSAFDPYHKDVSASYLDLVSDLRIPHTEIFEKYKSSVNHVFDYKTNNHRTLDFHSSLQYDYLSKLVKSEVADRVIYSSLGYHKMEDPQCTLSQAVTNVIRVNDHQCRLIELQFNNRYEKSVSVAKIECQNTNEIRGCILFLHGRDSTPQRVLGINKQMDYHRQLGLRYSHNGYQLYAIQLSSKGENFDSQNGLTSYGNDISNILDLMQWLKNKHDNLPLILGGISYGAHLSEIISLCEKDVDITLSIGGSARGDNYDRLKSGTLKPDYFYLNDQETSFRLLFAGTGILKALMEKPLIVSVGTWDHGVDKIELIKNLRIHGEKQNLSQNLFVNLFKGFHESDPEGELMALNSAIKLLQKPRDNSTSHSMVQ